MEFVIYELTDPIYDPETKESLSQLEIHKGRLRVIHLQDKLATATTLTRKLYEPSFSEVILPSPFRKEGRWVEAHEKLPIEQSESTAVETDLTVRLGDLVRSVS